MTAASVLVVEDEPQIAAILAHKLRREGHQVTVVRSAAALVELCRSRHDCDVALVDVSLEEDGVELVERLRPERLGLGAGWLALVESRDRNGSGRASLSSASGVIEKPFKPTAVASRVAELLAASARA